MRVERGVLVWSAECDDTTRIVFKMYRYRGMWTSFRERVTRFRVEREYQSLCHLVQHDIPCSIPLFWTRGYCRRQGYYEILAMREIEDATPLGVLVTPGADPDGVGDLAPLFRIVRRMHSSGLHHGALVARNILVTTGADGSWSFHVIDMPRALAFPRDVFDTRMGRIDLMDLTRSLLPVLGDERCLALLESYGMDAGGGRSLLETLEGYRCTRHTRNRLQGEFKLRSWFARHV
jgi:tRNA A-37 threonylcarbamoyl transferase component Bud32